jgi:hypothetical protein
MTSFSVWKYLKILLGEFGKLYDRTIILVSGWFDIPMPSDAPG